MDSHNPIHTDDEEDITSPDGVGVIPVKVAREQKKTKEKVAREKVAKEKEEIKNNIVLSNNFQDYIQTLDSYKAIRKFIDKAKSLKSTTKRGTNWKTFLDNIVSDRPEDWLAHFETCYELLAKIYSYNLDWFTEAEIVAIRAQHGVIGDIITNKKMNSAMFLLINDLFYDIRNYLHQRPNTNVPKPLPPFLAHSQKIELQTSFPKRSDQHKREFERDKGVMEGWLDDEEFYKDNPELGVREDLHKKRCGIVKRLYLALGLNGDEIQFKNENAGVYQNLGEVNSHLGDQGIPLASLLCHGGRFLIQVPPIQKGEDPDKFLKYVLGGNINDPLLQHLSDSHNNTDAAKEGKVAHKRHLATHSLKVKNGIVKEKKSITGAPGENHLGVNLGLGEPENPMPETGSYGHLYMNWRPPTETEPGALLFGIEGSAPANFKNTVKNMAGLQEPLISYAGDEHTTAATSSDISPTAGGKWRNMNHLINPAQEGGFRLELNAPNLAELYTHRADELTSDYLEHPAGVTISKLSSTKTATTATAADTLTPTSTTTNAAFQIPVGGYIGKANNSSIGINEFTTMLKTNAHIGPHNVKTVRLTVEVIENSKNTIKLKVNTDAKVPGLEKIGIKPKTDEKGCNYYPIEISKDNNPLKPADPLFGINVRVNKKDKSIDVTHLFKANEINYLKEEVTIPQIPDTKLTKQDLSDGISPILKAIQDTNKYLNKRANDTSSALTFFFNSYTGSDYYARRDSWLKILSKFTDYFNDDNRQGQDLIDFINAEAGKFKTGNYKGYLNTLLINMTHLTVNMKSPTLETKVQLYQQMYTQMQHNTLSINKHRESRHGANGLMSRADLIYSTLYNKLAPEDQRHFRNTRDEFKSETHNLENFGRPKY